MMYKYKYKYKYKPTTATYREENWKRMQMVWRRGRQLRCAPQAIHGTGTRQPSYQESQFLLLTYSLVDQSWVGNASCSRLIETHSLQKYRSWKTCNIYVNLAVYNSRWNLLQTKKELSEDGWQQWWGGSCLSPVWHLLTTLQEGGQGTCHLFIHPWSMIMMQNCRKNRFL